MKTMMNQEIIYPLADERATLETAGGKGASLARLSRAGLPVPGGFHITTTAYRHFVEQNALQNSISDVLAEADPAQLTTLEVASKKIQDLFQQGQMPAEIEEAITQAYTEWIGKKTPVAVRSSATAEDLPDLSFAGQQETFLNIQGTQAVREAVQKCWASLWTARAISYRMQHQIDQGAVSLAVTVQKLVPAEAAGILFTANPLNRRSDQMVINAAWGLGEAVVGGQVTPDTIIVDKVGGSVIERQTADKQVMTVRVEGATENQAVPQALRQAAVLDDDQAAELARLGTQIENLYRKPMDIEWALAAGELTILQARPITAMHQPEEAIKIEWIPPSPKGQYMRASAVDLMPDPLSPLFASIGIQGLIDGVYRLGKKLLRSEPILPKDYFTTINSYAYGNAHFTPREWWWILTGMLPAYPRLMRMLVPFWKDEAHPQYQAEIAQRQGMVIGTLSSAELWREIQELLKVNMDYLSSLMFATLGASAGSEGLLTKMYDKLVKREGDPQASALLMGYDSIPVRADKSLFDLANWCAEKPEVKAYFLTTPAGEIWTQIQQAKVPPGIPTEDWQALRQRFEAHLHRFGHIIYELDFAKQLPLDDPAPMLEVCKMYLRGEGRNPYQRQAASEAKRKQTTQVMLSRLKGLRKWAFRKALNWGQSMAEVREDALADIGLGYPLLRRMLLELGSRFARAGAIENPEDIFWLVEEEIVSAVSGLEKGQALESLLERVKNRKVFWRAAKRLTPPPMLPPKDRIYGIKAEVFTAAAESSQSGNGLKGVPASGGKITASACVLHGPEDFSLMKPGSVLVAGTTTPAWTPLFAMASAVVTDIGGPLSHGSIVAREYGIPAVMGTGVATRRIQTGQVITVDGNAGLVTWS